jgi:FtsP/CotA-like multicopper oxidase with cupredoxin domain
MKAMAAVLLLVLLANPVSSAAVARDKAAYVGGTLARFNRSATAIEGRVEIPVLPVLRPVRHDSSADYYEIAQRRASVEIIRGTRTEIWGYDGSFPGPTIEARRGRATVVTHTNDLGVPTVTHLHGGMTRPQSDGFPTDTLAPGEARPHEYDNLGRPATLWYHDHSWPATGRNLYMGLAGFYLLKEDSEIESQLPNGPYDVPLMLHDRAFTADGQLDYDHDGHHGATGRVMLVNGAPWPFLEVAARKYRFRVLNASNATAMRLALSTHQPLIQIASDQGLLAAPVVLPTIALAMAERVEVVVDFSVYPLGTRVVLENRRREGSLRSVMRFDVVRTARDDSRVPDRLDDIEPLDRSHAVRTRTFVFGGKPTLGVPPGVRWVINDEPFDPLRVDATPRLDDVEVWRFVNRPFLGRTMLHPVRGWRRVTIDENRGAGSNKNYARRVRPDPSAVHLRRPRGRPAWDEVAIEKLQEPEGDEGHGKHAASEKRHGRASIRRKCLSRHESIRAWRAIINRRAQRDEGCWCQGFRWRLRPASSAKSLRAQPDGKVLITDGP